MPLTFTPLQPFGAEAAGASGGELASPEAAARCQAALDAHGVLVFREVHIGDDDLVALSRLLGDVVPARTGEHERPEIATITLDPAKTSAILAHYRQGNFQWHIDGATDDVPQKATLLTAREVDPAGGDTEFASGYLAWDALTTKERQHLAGLRVVHSFAAAQARANPSPTERDRQLWHRVPARVHPLVWTRRSGRKSLLLGATADVVVGMPDKEGRALLEDLLERATAPGATLRHHWRRGDLVIWDNTGMLHRALPFEPASPRVMHRITLAGVEEVA
jgi:alpha-ketoglutarate-dependent taurine dioxygenase